jgi:hypothetical protein
MVAMRIAGNRGPWFCGLFLACFALVAGCGGSGKHDDGGVTAEAIIEAQCAWETRCGRGPCYRPVCNFPVMRTEAVAAAVRCYKTLACDGDSDECEELAAYNTVPNAKADIESCLDRYSASCPQYSDIDVGLCLGYPLLIPSKQAEFNQCFEQGICAEPCLIAVGSLCEQE